jgi:arabinose-5-phosphate isomerase
MEGFMDNLVLKKAKEILRIEANSIKALIGRVGREFERAVGLLCDCRGRVIVTGMGKPGIVAQKISATLSSTGTPSMWLHPAEAIHGDLGKVTKEDVVIAISNSGETEEITKLLPTIKKIGSKLISLTGNTKSTLAKLSDCVLDVSVKEEACPLGLAPSASTTATLAMGDALALVVAYRKGFKIEDFAFFHPGGSLGKRLLLRVKDIMRTGKKNPVVNTDTSVKKALFVITGARSGSVSVVDAKGKLVGIFTDGDLRRHIETNPRLLEVKIKYVMTKNPVTVKRDSLAAEAFRVLRERRIDEVPVVDDAKRPVGLLDVQDLLKEGLV